MTFTRRLTLEEWLEDRYCWLGDASVQAGVSLHEMRDAAVLRDKLERALGNRTAEVIDFPGVAVRAVN
jgi:hypothetical protein